MAETEVGASFSIGDFLLGVKAELFGKLDGIDKRLASILQREEQYEREGPVFVALSAAGVVDANQDPLYLDLGGPSYGRAWEVRQLVIGGVTWATTVAGYALVLVQSTAPSTLVGVGLSGIQDEASGSTPALPSVAFYSSGQFHVRHPNHVYVAVIGGTASTPYVVAGDAFDVPDVPARGLFSI
jgi:hypothetical protein